MHAKTVRFEQWKSPDQLRAGALSGSYHVAATPVNVAANLYNKGAPIRLLDVTVWGVLSIVTTDAGITSIADLKGREIAVPFRGDVPDIVLRGAAASGPSARRVVVVSTLPELPAPPEPPVVTVASVGTAVTLPYH